VGGKPRVSRTVLRNCIEVEKAAAWKKRTYTDVVHVQPFIPEHDFAEDDLYLKLSANLTLRDIEWCKARMMGFSGYGAMEQIHPDMKNQSRSYALTRMDGRDDLLALIKHFTTLWNKYHNPLSFDPVEAVADMIREVRNAEGRQKFEMYIKLIEVLDIGESVKAAAKKYLNLNMEPGDEEESIEEFIRKLHVNGKIKHRESEFPFGEGEGSIKAAEAAAAAEQESGNGTLP
jgi:hypothetical protein